MACGSSDTRIPVGSFTGATAPSYRVRRPLETAASVPILTPNVRPGRGKRRVQHMAESSRGKLAIVTGGGPAPGINGVISSVTIEAINQGLEVVGIRDGFKHLVTDRFNP